MLVKPFPSMLFRLFAFWSNDIRHDFHQLIIFRIIHPYEYFIISFSLSLSLSLSFHSSIRHFITIPHLFCIKLIIRETGNLTKLQHLLIDSYNYAKQQYHYLYVSIEEVGEEMIDYMLNNLCEQLIADEKCILTSQRIVGKMN